MMKMRNFSGFTTLCLALRALGLVQSAPAPAAQPAGGTLWAWGNNSHGQLGLGDNAGRMTPVRVEFPPGDDGAPVRITALSGGDGSNPYTLALDAEGKLWAWGDNSFSQLGIGSGPLRQAPVQVQFPERADGSSVRIVEIASASGGGWPGAEATESHSLALDEDGTLWAWGGNSRGQLGDGTTTPQTLPVRVLDGDGDLLGNIVAIAANHNHSLALDGDGTLWAWGSNFFGQLGTGEATLPMSSTPVRVQFPEGDDGSPVRIAQIASGFYHALALDTTGMMWGWGHNSRGQAGDGTMTPDFTSRSNDRFSPVRVVGPGGEGLLGEAVEIVAIAGGLRSSYAVDSTGTVWSWGINVFGQLGHGSGGDRPEPDRVSGDRDVLFEFDLVLLSLEEQSEMPGEGRGIFYVARDSSGHLRFRTFDQGGERIADVAEEDGVLAANQINLVKQRLANFWDRDDLSALEKRQLLSVMLSILPIEYSLRNVIALASGPTHVLAVDSEGGAWAWGANGDGALGVGDIQNRAYATQVRFPLEAGETLRIGGVGAGRTFSLAWSAVPETAWALAYARAANGALVFTWDDDADGGPAVLEQSHDLRPGSWTTVPVQEPGRHEVTVNEAPATFFRLRTD